MHNVIFGKKGISDLTSSVGMGFQCYPVFANFLQSLALAVYQEGFVMFPQLEWWARATECSLTQSMIFIFSSIM